MDTTSEHNQPSTAALVAARAFNQYVAVSMSEPNATWYYLQQGDSLFGLGDGEDEAKMRYQWLTESMARFADTFAAPHIVEATARRQEAAAAELDAATLRGENAQLRRQLEAAEKMAKSIRMTKGEVDYDPCYEDGLGNTYTAYAMDTDYYHNMMGALRGWDEAATPPLAAPIPDSIIETYEEGQG